MHNFELLKNDYIQHCYSLKDKDISQLECEDNYRTVYSLIESLEAVFPKEPTPFDSCMMFDAYRRMGTDRLGSGDKKKWLTHTKNFVDKCEKNTNDERLYKVMDCLPEMGTTKAEVFKYSCKAFDKTSSKCVFRPHMEAKREKSAENYYNETMTIVNQSNNDAERTKLCNGAEKLILLLPPTKRISAHRDCMAILQPIYNKTEHGRQELSNKQSSWFNRIWKSLPQAVQSVYKQRNLATR